MKPIPFVSSLPRLPTDPSHAARRLWKSPWLAGLALFAAAWAIYWPLVHAGYIWDDAGWIYQNPVLRHWHGLWWIWFKFGDTIQYYPLTFTGFFLQYRLWAGHPLGYHIVNILLQAAAGILLWRVLRRLGCRWAWLAALLFTIDPVQVETVGWAAEQKNLLSGILYFSAFLFYLRFLGFQEQAPAAATRPAYRWYLLATVFFALALLAKTAVCTLPAVLLVVIWWRRGRLPWRDVLATIPWFILGLVMGLVTIVAEREQSGAHGSAFHFTWAQRTIIAGRDVWFYLFKLIWPHPLLEIYPRWHLADLHGWAWCYPLAVVLLVAVLWGLRQRLGRGPLAAIAFFLLTLFPTLGFISFYTMIYTFVADHYQYLACIGPIVLVVETLAWVYEKGHSRLKTISASVAASPRPENLWRAGYFGLTGAGVLMLALVAYAQTWVYVPPQRVWSHVLRYDPTNWAAMENLASCEFADHHDRRAWLLYQQAEMLPGGDNYLVHQDMGDFALRLLRNSPLAAAEYRRSLAFDSHNLTVIEHLIACYERMGQWPMALADLGHGLRLFPRSANLHFTLAQLLVRAHHYKAAALQYTAVVTIEPRNTMAQYDLAVTLDQLAQPLAAMRHYRLALLISPQFVPAHFRYGLDLLKTGHAADAAAEFREAMALGKKRINILRQRGRLPPAAAWANQALVHLALAQAMDRLGNHAIARQQRDRAAQIQTWLKAKHPATSLGRP
ncbi:MAG: hypothetical protein HKL95_01305 [Phycisphaerae bacterium]|nr:hypothetical protein [Phycisphaerae bacterium]